MQRSFLWLFCLSPLLFVGCGTPLAEAPDIKLQISRQALQSLAIVKVWATGTKLKDGKALGCQALLDKKVAFDPKNISAEKQSSVLINGGVQQSLALEGLQPGEKIFVAAGYATEDDATKKEGSPKMLGCGTGTIEAGKKAMLSIFLTPYSR